MSVACFAAPLAQRVARAGWALALALPLWAGAHQGAHGSHAQPAPVPVASAPSPSPAAATLDAHTREDIERHQSMARAHTLAAQCLASGQSADHCQKQLQTACKGLALGKNCGMRHSH